MSSLSDFAAQVLRRVEEARRAKEEAKRRKKKAREKRRRRRPQLPCAPLTQEPRPIETADKLIARPMYHGGQWASQGLNWRESELVNLRTLCEARVAPEKAADALGRWPKSLAIQARKEGMVLPESWKALFPAPKKIIRASPFALNYPYIVKPRDEHAIVLEVNNLIPKAIPDHMRSDMCQEIMLAILEGKVSLEMLKTRRDNATYFIKRFYRDNFEDSGHALSFDNIERDDYTADQAVISAASKDWWQGQLAERHANIATLRMPYTAPDQLEKAHDSILSDRLAAFRRRADALNDTSLLMAADEFEKMLESAVP